ncbi:hypothetical protein like AT5G45320 [Hibiscus trionum]|uniref:Late embryogenesis abundant protein LEA-2 subgroup domain-containing protein n=1 Tax=Hibiscus trionum TaxID=183268 RepID=A0A9W7LH26_HIBTR|nr:hypothetical protein like AT5G45320 [Hibiscus trionum]
MPSNPRFSSGRERRTPLWLWCAAIVCTIITLAVIIAGIVTYIGYIVIHPRVPYVSVTHAHLNPLRLDYAGILQIQATIQIRAQNGNEKAHASFSDSNYTLSLNGEDIARLVASPFEVSKNSWIDFNYLVESSAIPLDPEQAENVDMALKHDYITLDLKGSSRVRWRVGRLGSVRFLCHLDCHLHFHPSNGTYIPSRCTSNAK